MFQHSMGRLKQSKRTVAGRFALMPDVFFLDPGNSILSADSTVVAHVPNAGLGIIALLLVTMLLFGFLMILGVSVLGSEAQLDSSDTTVQGMVVSHRFRTVSSMNQGVLHYVTYLYSVAGQETTYTKEQYVTESTFNDLTDGDVVMVKYLQTDPTVAELSGPDSTNGLTQNGYFMTVFGALGGLAALVFLVSRVWQFWRDDTLIRKGRLLMGEVVKCQGTLNVTKTSLDGKGYGSPLRGTYLIELSYVFHTPEGKEVEATAKSRRNDLIDQRLPELGTPVAILYLNERRYKVL
jgi:Protein of unknown function (DUF3592)